ncbi:MAG: DNA polymerase IV [Desulfobacterales bacterium]
MILHVDMDAFYASVEQLDAPELRGKCIIVGGRTHRGVVTAASYEARAFGIHAAMPMYRAKEKCPDAIIVPGRMSRYKEISEQIMALLNTFSPLVEPVSIDEAYMDISGCETLHGTPEAIGLAVKKRIRDRLELSCSVGIAPTKFLAKIASDMDKPDGLTLIEPDGVSAFIQALPIGKVPGVGKVMAGQLRAMGIHTLGDARQTPEKTLIDKLGKFGHRLIELSQNIDTSTVTPHRAAKSFSAEITLGENTTDRKLLNQHALKQSERVGRQLRSAGFRAKTVSIKIKHGDFKQATRSTTLTGPTDSSEEIYRAARRLMENYVITKPIRLIGVGTSGLVSGDTPVQMDLFPGEKEGDKAWGKVDKTVDSIVHRFGRGAISKASLQDL